MKMSLRNVITRDESEDKVKSGGTWVSTDGSNKWIPNDEITVAADVRCLGMRSGRGSYYGSTQCSAKGSPKWSKGMLCKKCSDETFETMYNRKRDFWYAGYNSESEDDIDDVWLQVRTIGINARHQQDCNHEDYNKLPAWAQNQIYSIYQNELSIHTWELHETYMEKKYIAEGKLHPDYLQKHLDSRRRQSDAQREDAWMRPIRSVCSMNHYSMNNITNTVKTVLEDEHGIPENTRITKADLKARNAILERFVKVSKMVVEVNEDAQALSNDIQLRKHSWEQTKPSLFGEEE